MVKAATKQLTKEQMVCYAASPWAFAWPPFLFLYPTPVLLFYSYHGLPYASTFHGSLDHRVILMPHLCLVYYFLYFFLSFHPLLILPHVH